MNKNFSRKAIAFPALALMVLPLFSVAPAYADETPQADPKMSCDPQGSGFSKLFDEKRRLQNAFDALNQNLYTNRVWINPGMKYSETLTNGVFSPDIEGTGILKTDPTFDAKPQNIFVYAKDKSEWTINLKSELELDPVLAHCVYNAMTVPYLGNTIDTDINKSHITLHYQMDKRIVSKTGKLKLKLTSRFFKINKLIVGGVETPVDGNEATINYPEGSSGFDLVAQVLDNPDETAPEDKVIVEFLDNDDLFISKDNAASTLPNNPIHLDGHIEGVISSNYAKAPANFSADKSPMYEAVDPTDISFIYAKIPANPAKSEGKCATLKYQLPENTDVVKYAYDDKDNLLAIGKDVLFKTASGEVKEVINLGKPTPAPDCPREGVSDEGTQTDKPDTKDEGVGDDEVNNSTDSGTQTDNPATTDSGTQTDSKVNTSTNVGTQTDNPVMKDEITQTDSKVNSEKNTGKKPVKSTKELAETGVNGLAFVSGLFTLLAGLGVSVFRRKSLR